MKTAKICPHLAQKYPLNYAAFKPMILNHKQLTYFLNKINYVLK